MYHCVALAAAREACDSLGLDHEAAFQPTFSLGTVASEGLDLGIGMPGSLMGLDHDMSFGAGSQKKLLFTLADLEGVSRTKLAKEGNPEATTIMHLCGNKWCLEPGHYFVGTKRFNDDQAYCHRGLHKAGSRVEYEQIQSVYCKHDVKCWANPYKGEFDLTPAFVETGLTSKLGRRWSNDAGVAGVALLE